MHEPWTWAKGRGMLEGGVDIGWRGIKGRKNGTTVVE